MSSMADIIGMNPLVSQMQNQGINLGALANVSPSSANFQPDTVRPPMPPTPNATLTGNMGAMPPTPPVAPPVAPQPAPPTKSAIAPEVYSNEAQQIIAALVKRLEAGTKIQSKAKIPA